MAKKHLPVRALKAGKSHGNFKHVAKGTTLRTVLGTYGLKRSDYERVRELVGAQLSKVPAHGR